MIAYISLVELTMGKEGTREMNGEREKETGRLTGKIARDSIRYIYIYIVDERSTVGAYFGARNEVAAGIILTTYTTLFSS